MVFATVREVLTAIFVFFVVLIGAFAIPRSGVSIVRFFVMFCLLPLCIKRFLARGLWVESDVLVLDAC